MIQNLKYKEETDFALCNFENPEHCKALCDLLNMYMADPMGDYPQHDEEQNRKLVEDMKNYPTSISLFVLADGKPVGFVNGFMNYSTFRLKPFINLHDVFVMPEYRGRGLSRKLISKMKEIARDNGCCKLTLEVRYDNPVAQACYRAEGFDEDVPPMHYWEKMF